jgi:hypothetical protein
VGPVIGIDELFHIRSRFEDRWIRSYMKS